MTSLTQQHRRPPRSRWLRFLSSGLMLARVYLGYKRISFLQRWRGEGWGETQRQHHHRWSAQRIYDTAVRDQGLLIKTCQFLSTRPDIVPDAYTEVLSKLQDEVPPEPFAVTRRTIERELGRRLEDIYAEFDPEPVASASLAQVHRAVLKDGRIAAVKVQYPGIEKLVDVDLRNIEVFVQVLNRLDKTLDFSFIAEEMSRMIPLELDFVHEGHNAEAIAANFAGVEDIVVPDIYWEFTTRRVLTMEYVDGVKITDIRAMERLGIDPADVAKVLVVAFSEMLVQHGLFHADPHPGNLLVAPGPKLVLVDFGQVKDVSPAFRLIFGQMTRALLAQDDSAVGKTFRDLGFRMKQDSDEGYVALGDAYVGNVSKRMMAQQGGWVTPEMMQDSYRDALRLLRTNPLLKIPPELLFVGRVMGLLNGLSMILRSRTNLLIEMARLLDQNAALAASRTNGVKTDAVEPVVRRLLEA